MKRSFVFAALCVMIGSTTALAACSSGDGSGNGAPVNYSPFGQIPGQNSYSAPQVSSGTNSVADPANNTGSYSQFIGTWVHEYEYFGSVYKTTLIISSGGTAAYYNEEAELGNFSGSWAPDANGYIKMTRSDGVVSYLYADTSRLTEYTVEDGQTYTAEYYRQ